MSKLNKILFGVVVVLVIILAGVVYWQYFEKSDNYWAVYLSTGDIYIGKLSYFPRLHVSNVWFFQQTGNEQNPLSLSKFDKVFWGPEDNIYLNEEQIIWKTKLSDSSQILSYIKNPQSSQGGSQPGVQSQLPQQQGENSAFPPVQEGQ